MHFLKTSAFPNGAYCTQDMLTYVLNLKVKIEATQSDACL